MNIVLRFIACSIWLVLLGQAWPLTPRSVWAASLPANKTPTQKISISLNTLGRSDILLNGVDSSQDVYFTLADTWELQPGAHIHLLLNSSGLLDPLLSTLTLDLNDQHLASVGFPVSKVITHQTLDISVPVETIHHGYNRLHFTSHLALSHDIVCIDPNNAALWITVQGQTMLELFYRNSISANLALFPQPLVPPYSYSPSSICFVLPTSPSPEELQAAGLLAARLGQGSRGESLTIPVIFPPTNRANLAAQCKNGIVAFGTPADQPLLEMLSGTLPVQLTADRHSFQLPDHQQFTSGDGLLEEIVLPEGLPLLLVTGENDTGITKAGAVLGNPSVSKLLGGSYALIKTLPLATPLLSSQLLSTADTTFDKLGFQDQTVRGAGQHTINASFLLPINAQAQEGAYLDLATSYSNLVSHDQSALVVSLNGVPLKSDFLKPEETPHSFFHVPLPVRLLQAGQNTINIAYRLALPNLACQAHYDDVLYATVTSNSLLHLPFTVGRSKPDLGLYSFPFTATSDLSSVALIVPDNPNQGELQAALALAQNLGQASNGKLSLELLTASRLTATERRQRHLILLSTGDDNSVLHSLGSFLPVHLGDHLSKILQTNATGAPVPTNSGFTNQPGSTPGTITASEQDNQPTALIEEITSPYEPGHLVLAILSTGSEQLHAAVQVLQGHTELRGTILLINGNPALPGSIHSLGPEETINAASTPDISHFPTTVSPRLNNNPLLVIVLGVGIVIIIGLAIYILRSRPMAPPRT